MADQQVIELRGTDDDVLRGTITRATNGKLAASGVGVALLRQAAKYGEAPADTWARMRGFCNGPLRAVAGE